MREVIKSNQIELRYLSTDEMAADILTNLNKTKHVQFVDSLGLK